MFVSNPLACIFLGHTQQYCRHRAHNGLKKLYWFLRCHFSNRIAFWPPTPPSSSRFITPSFLPSPAMAICENLWTSRDWGRGRGDTIEVGQCLLSSFLIAYFLDKASLTLTYGVPLHYHTWTWLNHVISDSFTGIFDQGVRQNQEGLHGGDQVGKFILNKLNRLLIL